MSDWAPGDLALCVNAGDWGGFNPHGPRLTVGRTYTVLQVVPAAGWVDAPMACGLVIDGPANTCPDGEWHEGRFRKIRPHKADAEDRETIALLNGKPVPVEA